jgi:hypothetical protein
VALLVFGVLVSEGTPAGLLRRGPFTSDFFDAQVHSILDGRLDVEPDVAGIEGFVHDGRTQLYFGLVPAVVRLPIVALTHRFDGRLTQLSMLVALALALWASTRLLWRARTWRRGDRPVGRWEPWIVGGFIAAVGLSSPLLFLAARPVVYHETELWGTATTLIALEALLGWWSRPDRRRLVVASVAALVAMNTRASVGGGAVAALALTAALALAVRRVPWRVLPGLAAAVLLPVIVYAAVNQARFDDPFSVPFRDQVLSSFDPARQATLAATDGSLFGPEFAPTALVTYIRPDGVGLQRLFPWITFHESTDVIGDATFDTVDRTASLPVVAPSFVVLGLVGLGALLRRGWRDPWLTAIVGTAVGLVATITIAFIANRYLADFTPTLVLTAAIGTWAVADWLGQRARALRRIATGALVALTCSGLAVSAALAAQSQRLFILPSTQARHDLVAFQYDLHERLGGDPPPGVRRAAALEGPGRRGEVVVLGACRGLYWSDGERWWPLELGGRDGWVVTGPVRGETTALLDAGAWRVVAEGDGATVRVSFEHTDGTIRRGEPVDRSDLDGQALGVWLDRVNSELTVTAGGHAVLVAWLVDLTGDAEPGPTFTARPAPTPLCDDLVARLAR